MARQVQDIQFEYTPLDLKDAVLYKPPFELIKESLTNKAKTEAANYGLSNVILPEVLSEVDYLPENAEEAESILSGYNDRINDITKSLQENPSDKNALENLYKLSSEIHENTMSPRGKLSIMQRRIDALAAFDDANAQYRKEDPDRYEIFRNQVKDDLLNADSEIDMTNAIRLLQTQLNIPKGYIEDFEKAFEQKIRDYGYDKMGQSSPDIAMQEANAAMMGLTDEDKNGNTTTMGSYLAQEYDGQIPKFLVKRNGKIIINPELHAKDIGYAQMAYNLYENLIKIQQVPVNTKSSSDDDGNGIKKIINNIPTNTQVSSSYAVTPDLNSKTVLEYGKSNDSSKTLAYDAYLDVVFKDYGSEIPQYRAYYSQFKTEDNGIMAIFKDPELLSFIIDKNVDVRDNDWQKTAGKALISYISNRKEFVTSEKILNDGITQPVTFNNKIRNYKFAVGKFGQFEVALSYKDETSLEMANKYKEVLSKAPDKTFYGTGTATRIDRESDRKELCERDGFDYEQCKKAYQQIYENNEFFGIRTGNGEWDFETKSGDMGEDIMEKLEAKKILDKDGKYYNFAKYIRKMNNDVKQRIISVLNQNNSVKVECPVWETSTGDVGNFAKSENVENIKKAIKLKCSQDIAAYDWTLITKDMNSGATIESGLQDNKDVFDLIRGGEFKLNGITDYAGRLGFVISDSSNKTSYTIFYNGPINFEADLIDSVCRNISNKGCIDRLANRDIMQMRRTWFLSPQYNGKKSIWIDESFMEKTGENIPLFVDYTNEKGQTVRVKGKWLLEKNENAGPNESPVTMTFYSKMSDGSYQRWIAPVTKKIKIDGKESVLFEKGKNYINGFYNEEDAFNTIDASTLFADPNFASHNGKGVVNSNYGHKIARYLGFPSTNDFDRLLNDKETFNSWSSTKNDLEKLLVFNYMIFNGKNIELKRDDCSGYCFGILNSQNSGYNSNINTTGLIQRLDNGKDKENGFELMLRQGTDSVDIDKIKDSLSLNKAYVVVFDRNSEQQNHMAFVVKVVQNINGQPKEVMKVIQYSQSHNQTTKGMNIVDFDENYIESLKGIKNVYLLKPTYFK